MKMYVDSSRIFFVSVTSSLMACYGIWLYQGCHVAPPFISFFAHGLSAHIFSYGISISAIIAANVMRQIEVLRRRHASQRESKMLKVQSYVSLFFGLSGIVCMLNVCYYPWNYQDGREHGIAAVAAYLTICSFQTTHTAGTLSLWYQDKARWTSGLIRQVCVVGLNYVCAIALVLRALSIYDIGAVSFTFIRRLPDNTDGFLKICQAGSFNAAGFGSEMQKEAHLLAALEWAIFITMSLFLWAAPDPVVADLSSLDPLLESVESQITHKTEFALSGGGIREAVSPVCVTKGVTTKHGLLSAGKPGSCAKGMTFTDKSLRIAAASS